MNFLEIKKVVFFEPKNWWKDDITDYWKVHVLNFSVMGNKVFFWVKNLMQRWYLLVTEKFLFWTFRWWEIRSFFSQKVDGKMIFTWSFWAFYDIPGPGKYGFSRSDVDFVYSNNFRVRLLWKSFIYSVNSASILIFANKFFLTIRL